MNRIILIGNGFDLAHGLPTRYEDFINWYWDQWLQKLKNCHYRSLSDSLCKISIKTGQDTWHSLLFQLGYMFEAPRGVDFIAYIIGNKDNFEFTQVPLLEKICKSIHEKKWVDIENEYYNLLCNCLFKPDECDYSISELNSHLRYVQELLVQYLSSITNVEINCDKGIWEQIYAPLRKNDISISQLHKYYDYVDYLIQHVDDEYQRILYKYGIDDSEIYFLSEDLKKLQTFSKSTEIEEVYLRDMIRPSSIMFLNFNYTIIADKYKNNKVSIVNHIHGNLSNSDSIIFGYGDELDEDYKKIQKHKDEGCLNNIKSIKYLEFSNYRKLLQFIESAPYQVYIMGHSCGNSDRTLLNTLFEHKNCVSIKPYYYQTEDGNDNYMEIIQNISRNFTDMKLMRDRVVNKTYCEPLHQLSK